MPISDQQWNTVSPTEFPWEQEAFDYIKLNAPTGTVAAWSNFEFVAPNGSIYEVDLMVLTITELFLIEIKSWGGTLDGTVNNLVRYGHNPADSRTVPNPLLLLNRKAKILASILREQPSLKNQRVPFVQPLLFFNNQNLNVRIPAPERPNIHHGSEIIEALAPKSNDLNSAQKKLNVSQVKALNKAFQQLGIRRLNRTAKVGDWVLGDLLEDTERYQDHIAHHQSIAESFRRVRTYTIPLKAASPQQELARRAARREFTLTDALQHPGILKPLEYKEHEYGPALVYFYDKDSERLDHFLAGRNALLSTEIRLDLVRQLADTLRYAHARRIYHRGLSPQNILVLRPDSSRPQLQMMNWQTGMEAEGTTGTSHISALMDDVSKAYMAPEACNQPSKSPGDLMDVFALGAVAYYIFSGEPPAESQLALYQKLQEHSGLRLSSVTDGLTVKLEEFVELCTQAQGTKRPSNMEEVLRLLDEATEAQNQDEQQEVFNPLDALLGSELPGGFRVERDLGKGSVAKALEVTRSGHISVLKVAHDITNNERMEEEARVLESLDHPHIVKLEAQLELGGRTCLLLQRAGETLAQRLADWGPLQIDQLNRFGTDLLSALVYLEKAGVRHRDIKPANLGITPREKGAPRLLLFDFSLATTPVESIGAGTPDYIDPFLRSLRPPRWDQFAERYAAGVTLYEMATAALPRWGDGRSDPGLDPTVTLELEVERFDPVLREGLTEFFESALNRDRKERFDNAEEMLAAWTEALREATESDDLSLSAEDMAQRIAQASRQSTLASLGLDLRSLRALDRLGAVTVEQLLALPSGTLHTAVGVGAQTRKKLAAVQESLRQHLPEALIPTPVPLQDTEELEQGVLEVFLTNALGKGSKTDQAHRAAFLGQSSVNSGLHWPSLSELAKLTGQAPLSLGKQIPTWRREWAKSSQLRFVRDELNQLLQDNGGVLSAEEAALGLLSAHGALSNDHEQRRRMAASVTRAAIEAEGTEAEARFLWQRVASTLVVARSDAHVRYLEKLGNIADEIAVQEPLLPPKRASQRIREVDAPEGLGEISVHRLLCLAASCSKRAAVSAREEIYPRGMEAQRALILAHGVLVGDRKLAQNEIQTRVSSRYPEAQLLPPRPELDRLLEIADGDLRWSETDEAYVRKSVLTTTSGSTSIRRFSTATGTRAPGSQPEVAEARRFEERLQHAYNEDSFLVVMAQPGHVEEAEVELLRRFSLERRQLDRMLLQAIKDVAARAKAKWEAIITIDAQGEGNSWRKLNRLVGDAMVEVEKTLLSSDRPQLLTNPGLLRRYGQMDVLEKLRDAAGSRDGIPAVWLLLPTEEASDLPTLDGEAIALIDSGQRTRIPTAWLENRHRAAKTETTAQV